MDPMPGSAERERRRPADAGAASGDEDGRHGVTLRVNSWRALLVGIEDSL